MRTNDQWFEPGDKVMRVAYAYQIGKPCNLAFHSPPTDFGIVLCVESCFPMTYGNRVTFVGIQFAPGSDPPYAACFRRVEEIKLCVRAANRMSGPVEETQNV